MNKVTDHETRITQNAEKITQTADKVDKIETAGYVTEETVNAKIEESANSIELSVKGSIKVGTSNMFYNSACFASFSCYDYTTDNTVFSDDINTVGPPSGKAKKVIPFGTGTVHGFYLKSENIIKEPAGNIKKLKPDTEYILSFWAATDAPATNLLNKMMISGGTAETVYIGNPEIALTEKWKRFYIPFKFKSRPSDFRIRFLYNFLTSDPVISISSLKLEEGNVPTDWGPNPEDINQEVEAKLELYVEKDENGKLVSAIDIESNMISIKSDNFELKRTGEITSTAGTIGGWNIGPNGLYKQRYYEESPTTKFDIGYTVLNSSNSSGNNYLSPAISVGGISETDFSSATFLVSNFYHSEYDIKDIAVRIGTETEPHVLLKPKGIWIGSTTEDTGGYNDEIGGISITYYEGSVQGLDINFTDHIITLTADVMLFGRPTPMNIYTINTDGSIDTYNEYLKLNRIELKTAEWGCTWPSGSQINADIRDIIQSEGGMVITANNGDNALYLHGNGIYICGNAYIKGFVDGRNGVSLLCIDRKTGEIRAMGDIA